MIFFTGTSRPGETCSVTATGGIAGTAAAPKGGS
jgi:hypothetical protein